MLVLSKMIQILPVKITARGTDGKCHSLNVHKQAQCWLAACGDSVLPACQGRQGAGSSKAHPYPRELTGAWPGGTLSSAVDGEPRWRFTPGVQ